MPLVPVNRHRPEQKAACDLTIYCGRGSALGNPFPITPTASRTQVIELYHEWLDNRIEQHDPAVMAQLHHIWESQKRAVVGLECFCHPLPCHTSHIIAAVNRLWPEA